ncbi:MAG: TetR/AcrR family transcriptional regulator [Proteobacteria bacterium]|nr:TetR/AcrR family transcriptional regulator [Pseudomonadota bacterium]
MRDGTATRLRIEKEALRLFVEKGVAETSVRDVAQAAGVADGALYRHYASKDALIWNLFSTHYTGFARRLDQLAAARGTRARLDAMIAGFCRFFDEDPVLFRFLLFVQHGQLRKITPEMPSPIDAVRSVIAAGMRRGDIPKTDSDLATAMVMGIVLQTATFTVYGRLRGPLLTRSRQLSTAAWTVLSLRS